ncbi:MAG: hypothetical protein IV100_00760 [Myxococcales bacterium]|nr:hypothetical protein [Myxococcales bacterium]
MFATQFTIRDGTCGIRLPGDNPPVNEEPLIKFLDLVKARLGADDVRAEIGGREPVDPNVLVATVRPGVRVVAVFDDGLHDAVRLKERLDGLVSVFGGSTERPASALEIPAPDANESLELALLSLAERASAIRALVVDEQSPIVWGTSSPESLPSDVATATSIAHTADALERAGLDLASLIAGADPDLEGTLGKSSLSPAEKRGILGVISALTERGGLRTADAWKQDVLVARAVALTRRQRDVSLLREPQLGVFARSFANIYRLLLVYDGRFSPLQAEAATIQALPVIENLVARLPPVDPSPGGKVVALRRS